eukprot:scaffold149099_cov15-Prasinocladus_malaysianus.AAC.1
MEFTMVNASKARWWQATRHDRQPGYNVSPKVPWEVVDNGQELCERNYRGGTPTTHGLHEFQWTAFHIQVLCLIAARRRGPAADLKAINASPWRHATQRKCTPGMESSNDAYAASLLHMLHVGDAYTQEYRLGLEVKIGNAYDGRKHNSTKTQRPLIDTPVCVDD